MARLNDPQSESLEALKKRYIRQNREIARANSTQSVRIRNLESETTRLLSENIGLREQVIKLQASLDKRDRNRTVVENVEEVQKKLEEKVKEMNELVKGLGVAVIISPQGKSMPRISRPAASPDQRSWKDQYPPHEATGSPNRHLPSIDEDIKSRRSSWNNEEPRRSSLIFEEITLPPPKPDQCFEDDSDDEDLLPLVSSLLDIRPRRRRDSAATQDLDIPSKATKIQLPSAAPVGGISNRAPKRKFGEKDSLLLAAETQELDFRFTKVSERAAEAAKKILEIEESRPVDKDPAVEEEMVVEKNEPPVVLEKEENRAIGSNATKKKGNTSVATSISSTASRRALGPKTTNSDPSNSPLKRQASNPDFGKEKDVESEKPGKLEFNPPPTTKIYRGTNIRNKDTPPPDIDPAAVPEGRAARRTRPSVNYALPNLRDKMRREEGDAAKEVKSSSRRSISAASKGRKKDAEEFKIKSEELLEGGEEEVNWLNLPVAGQPPEFDEKRGKRGTEIASLLDGREKNEARKDGDQEPEIGLPATVSTHRRRRTSSQIVPAYGSNDGEASPEDAANADSRRKSDLFEAPGSSPAEIEFQRSERRRMERKREREKAREREREEEKERVYSHFPPSSAVGEREESESVLRGSRRVTLGGVDNEGIKGVRPARSNASLDEVIRAPREKTSGIAVSSRRRTTMV